MSAPAISHDGKMHDASERVVVETEPDVSYQQPSRTARDWHRAREGEPRCGHDQWRCRQRQWVVDISRMTSNHLAGALWYARRLEQHRSRLAALQAESSRRLGCTDVHKTDTPLALPTP